MGERLGPSESEKWALSNLKREGGGKITLSQVEAIEVEADVAFMKSIGSALILNLGGAFENGVNAWSLRRFSRFAYQQLDPQEKTKESIFMIKGKIDNLP